MADANAGDAPQYTADEQRAMRDAFAKESTVRCPRCDVGMTRREIGGGSFGLGYRRTREWLICPSCRRSAVFDVRRGTRN